jgi:hypothetical protein
MPGIAQDFEHQIATDIAGAKNGNFNFAVGGNAHDKRLYQGP